MFNYLVHAFYVAEFYPFNKIRIDLVYMYAIVFAMTVKPTTDDGWTILIAAAVLVTLTAIFLAPLRGGAAPELPAAATD